MLIGLRVAWRLASFPHTSSPAHHGYHPPQASAAVSTGNCAERCSGTLGYSAPTRQRDVRGGPSTPQHTSALLMGSIFRLADVAWPPRRPHARLGGAQRFPEGQALLEIDSNPFTCNLHDILRIRRGTGRGRWAGGHSARRGPPTPRDHDPAAALACPEAGRRGAALRSAASTAAATAAASATAAAAAAPPNRAERTAGGWLSGALVILVDPRLCSPSAPDGGKESQRGGRREVDGRKDGRSRMKT